MFTGIFHCDGVQGSFAMPSQHQPIGIGDIIGMFLNRLAGLQHAQNILGRDPPLKHALDGVDAKCDTVGVHSQNEGTFDIPDSGRLLNRAY